MVSIYKDDDDNNEVSVGRGYPSGTDLTDAIC